MCLNFNSCMGNSLLQAHLHKKNYSARHHWSLIYMYIYLILRYSNIFINQRHFFLVMKKQNWYVLYYIFNDDKNSVSLVYELWQKIFLEYIFLCRLIIYSYAYWYTFKNKKTMIFFLSIFHVSYYCSLIIDLMVWTSIRKCDGESLSCD